MVWGSVGRKGLNGRPHVLISTNYNTEGGNNEYRVSDHPVDHWNLELAH